MYLQPYHKCWQYSNVYIMNTTEDVRDFINENKFIILLSQIMKLAPKICPFSSCNQPITSTTWNFGAAVLIKFTCPESHVFDWASSVMHNDKRCNDSSLILSGSNITKIKMFFFSSWMYQPFPHHHFLLLKNVCTLCSKKLLDDWSTGNHF